MKLRLKGEAFPKPLFTEFVSNNVTVLDLKKRVSDLLKLDQEETSDLQLSLNGKSALDTTDIQTLLSLDFVSGDTVYILGVRPTELGRSTKHLKMNDSSSLNQQTLKYLPGSSQQDEEKVEEAHKQDQSTTKAHSSSMIPISETTTGETPEWITRLALQYPEKFQSDVDQLACMLHILLIDSGFHAESFNIVDTNQELYLTLPNWKSMGKGILQLVYKSSLPPYPLCTILIVNMVGSLYVVHGTSTSIKSSKLAFKITIDLAQYLPFKGGPGLQQLALKFKNLIAYPLLVTVQRETGGAVCPPNLSNLPPELLYTILKKLDAKTLCRLSSTSHLFQEVTGQPGLWKQLVIRDFKMSSVPENLDLKTYYKNEYIKKIRQERLATRLQQSLPRRDLPYPMPVPDNPLCIPPPLFPNPRYGSSFPGILGGPRDLFPDMEGFAPPGRRGGRSNIFPNFQGMGPRPRHFPGSFDPF